MGRSVGCCSLPPEREAGRRRPHRRSWEGIGSTAGDFQVVVPCVRRFQKQKHHGSCQRGLVSHLPLIPEPTQRLRAKTFTSFLKHSYLQRRGWAASSAWDLVSYIVTCVATRRQQVICPLNLTTIAARVVAPTGLRAHSLKRADWVTAGKWPLLSNPPSKAKIQIIVEADPLATSSLAPRVDP
jgi:hypothetical protein